MIIYSTVTHTTERVANHLAQRLGETQVINLKKTDWRTLNIQGRHLILLCPTYGDAELEEEFERFLFGTDWAAHRDMTFAFGELGLYAGYEDFSHGLIPIVESVLTGAGLQAMVPPISIDSVPMADWAALDAWASLILAAPSFAP